MIMADLMYDLGTLSYMHPYTIAMSRLYKMLIYFHLVMSYVLYKGVACQPLESLVRCRSPFAMLYPK